MRSPIELQDQLDEMSNDRLRVLVVGAGVAGLTLAQALRTEGLHPVLVERADPDADKGYMLALMPLVDPVIRKIGVENEYKQQSVPLHRYRLHGRHGDVIRDYSMDDLLAEYGDYRGIARGELLDVLSSGGTPVTFGVTISSIEQAGDHVMATLSHDGETRAEFDAVVAADGLHSSTRELVLRSDQVDWFDTDWGGWVAWTKANAATNDLGEETWGAGFFIGIYPVKGRDGVFVGGARSDTTSGPAQFVSRVRDDLDTMDERSELALEAISTGDDLYYWKFEDSRCATWSVNRVALVGDAAAGFLPTAGIGAAMAMESAGQLAGWLSQADRANVQHVLMEYERAQRPRVEAAQDNSRQLAHLMFRQSKVVAAARDVAAHFVTLKMALGPIRHLLDEAPAL